MRSLWQLVELIIKQYLSAGLFIYVPRIVAILLSLATMPIVLSSLPQKAYGIFAFTLSIQTWIIAFTGKNITLGAKRGLSRGFPGTFIYAFIKRYLIILPISVITIISASYIYNSGQFIIGILLFINSFYLIFGYLFFISYPQAFIAYKQFGILAGWQSAASVIITGSSALSAYFTHNVIIYAITYFVATSLVGWSGWLYVVNKHHFLRFYRAENIDKKCFKYGTRMIPSDLTFLTATELSCLIIGPLFGFINLAIFAVAEKLRRVFAEFLSQSNLLFYSDFSKLNENHLVRAVRKKIVPGIILSFIIMTMCISIGSLYIFVFLPPSYRMSILYFSIMSLGGIAFTLVLRTVLEVNFSYKEISYVTIISNVFKITAMLVLGYFFHIIGFCLGVVLAAWFQFLFYLFILKKSLRNSDKLSLPQSEVIF